MLVGRTEELERIDALLDGARAGNGGVLCLVGEPGIGKTALLAEAARRATSGFTVLRAIGRESEADLPHAALVDLLAPIAEVIDRTPPAQAAALRGALALAATVVTERLTIGAATLSLLSAAAADQPALALVDDLQWVDTSSREALLFASRRLAARRIAVLLALRSGELTAAETAGLDLVELRRLGPDDAAALLARTDPSLGSGTTRRVLAAAAGNPLALVELPRALAATAGTPRSYPEEPIAPSRALERAFGARLAALPETAASALLLAAADDSGSAATVAAALAAVELGLGSLEPAEQAGLVRFAAGRVEFRHPLVRSIVYHGAAHRDVRAAHAALARVEPDPDRRAWHRAAATPVADEEVAAELDGSARRALARAAPAAATRALERAARLTPDPPEAGRRLAAAARAAHRAGEIENALSLAGEARLLTRDPLVLADLLLVEGDLRMRAGDLEGAHRALAWEAESIAALDPRRAATMLLLASKLRIYRLEAAAALGEVDRALALLGEGRHEVVFLAARAMSHALAGAPDAREAALAAARAATQAAHGHAHTLAIAWPLIWLEEYEAARALVDRATRLQREAGLVLYLPQARLPQAELDFRTGRWVRALETGTEAVELFDDTGQPTEAAWAAAVLARLQAARGERDACRRLADRALASDVEAGLRAASAQALAAVGLFALGAGAADEAVTPLEAAERLVQGGGVGEPWLLQSTPDLVEALVRAGRIPDARTVLIGFEERARAAGRVSATAAALRCRALVSTDGDWQGTFEEALALHATVPTPFERARTTLCYGERLRRAKRRAAARAQLRDALAAFEQLGAAPWAERARAELRAAGDPAGTKALPLAALTGQELEVARLVAGGATNREAAATLFVSAKTIEFHLGNAYRKLGVRSRTELARRLVEAER